MFKINNSPILDLGS